MYWSIGVYAFLYIPIIFLIIYSFNESKLVSVWTGFSFRWYQAIFQDSSFLKAAWLSLKIATISASFALVLGTAAAFAITRFGSFRGKLFFNIMIFSPLVLPDIIIGISMLLMFVAFEDILGSRGMLTITIAHITFCTAYVTAIMQSQFILLDTSIEEAALDLGAKPIRVFMDIIIPIVLPGLMVAWLLSFTLSLDDVVISSFVGGPGSTTLPVLVFSKIRFGISPIINVFATFIIIFVSIIAALVSYNLYKKEKAALIMSMKK